jgi:hypothetical protein
MATSAFSLTIGDSFSIIFINLVLPLKSSSIYLLKGCSLENSPKSKQATACVVSSSESNNLISFLITAN